MTEAAKRYIRGQKRFRGITEAGNQLERRIPLSSDTIQEEQERYLKEALDAGLDGSQEQALGEEMAGYVGVAYGVPLSSGTAAMHLAVKLAAERLYGSASGIMTPDGLRRGGALSGKRVFCPDFTVSASVNPILYEGGEPIWIDSGETDWSMDPEVLEIAFQRYPEVRLVIASHVYGFPGRIQEIAQVCKANGALLIEDTSEALGARVWIGEDKPSRDDAWGYTGSFGDYAVLDFGAGRLVSGGGGGMLLTNDLYSAEKARYWAAQAAARAPWRQHEELGYSYGMGDLTAAAVRGSLCHIGERIAKKQRIYERYREKLEGDLARVIPVTEGTEPNYWQPCMTCESNIMFRETRDDRSYTYQDIHGTTSPMEIYDALAAFGVEAAPTYKPMSMQPIFRNCEQITLDGCRRSYGDFYNDAFLIRSNMAKQYFGSGLCLPAAVGMTEEEQDTVIEIVYACYDKQDLDRTM